MKKIASVTLLALTFAFLPPWVFELVLPYLLPRAEAASINTNKYCACRVFPAEENLRTLGEVSQPPKLSYESIYAPDGFRFSGNYVFHCTCRAAPINV